MTAVFQAPWHAARLPFSCQVDGAADSENEKEREGNRRSSDHEYWLKKEIDNPLSQNATELTSRHSGEIIPIEVVNSVSPVHPISHVVQEANRSYHDPCNVSLTQSTVSPC